MSGAWQTMRHYAIGIFTDSLRIDNPVVGKIIEGMTLREKQIESVARMLAAAYWRGRLKPLGLEGETLELVLKAVSDATLDNWKTAAIIAID